MKEFNLEEAKSGATVCTRKGNNARILCTDAIGKFPIIALIEFGEGLEKYQFPDSYMPNGKAYTYEEAGDQDDLMMKI